MSKLDLCFSSHAWDDYCYWQDHDWKTVNKINVLIKDIRRDPYKGIGKPEALKHELSGAWARRITQEHRLVYEVSNTAILIVQCRHHY